MTLEERLVDGDILDADGATVGDDVDHPIDQQEGIAVRDHLHDPLHVDGVHRRILQAAYRHRASPRLANRAGPLTALGCTFSLNCLA